MDQASYQVSSFAVHGPQQTQPAASADMLGQHIIMPPFTDSLEHLASSGGLGEEYLYDGMMATRSQQFGIGTFFFSYHTLPHKK